MSSQIYLQKIPTSEKIALHCFWKKKHHGTNVLGNFKSQKIKYKLNYIKILSGNPEARNSEQNLVTELKELRLISIIITSASGISFRILSLTPAARFKFLAVITTLTPHLAKTLAVSAPIPDVAPIFKERKMDYILRFFLCFLCLNCCEE